MRLSLAQKVYCKLFPIKWKGLRGCFVRHFILAYNIYSRWNTVVLQLEISGAYVNKRLNNSVHSPSLSLTKELEKPLRGFLWTYDNFSMHAVFETQTITKIHCDLNVEGTEWGISGHPCNRLVNPRKNPPWKNHRPARQVPTPTDPKNLFR